MAAAALLETTSTGASPSAVASTEGEPELTLEVTGLGGFLCAVSVSSSATVREVKQVLARKSSIPAAEQILVAGLQRLCDEELTLLDAVPESKHGSGLVLNLIRLKDPPSPLALRIAIKSRNIDTAMELLKLPWLPGLNDIDYRGYSLLHEALYQSLPDIAVTLIARSDFLQINAKSRGGSSALHIAAGRGFVLVCEALLARSDLEELGTRGLGGNSARDWAARSGHLELASLLGTAEKNAAAS